MYTLKYKYIFEIIDIVVAHSWKSTPSPILDDPLQNAVSENVDSDTELMVLLLMIYNRQQSL